LIRAVKLNAFDGFYFWHLVLSKVQLMQNVRKTGFFYDTLGLKKGGIGK